MFQEKIIVLKEIFLKILDNKSLKRKEIQIK